MLLGLASTLQDSFQNIHISAYRLLTQSSELMRKHSINTAGFDFFFPVNYIWTLSKTNIMRKWKGNPSKASKSPQLLPNLLHLHFIYISRNIWYSSMLKGCTYELRLVFCCSQAPTLGRCQMGGTVVLFFTPLALQYGLVPYRSASMQVNGGLCFV